MKTAFVLFLLAAAASAPLAAAPAAAGHRQDAPKQDPPKDKPADKPADKKDEKPADKPDDKPADKKDAKKVVAGEWSTDYEAALAEAKKQKKVVVANFEADWQEGCRKQKLEVFSKPEFTDWAKKHVILLKVEFPGNKPLPDELKKQNDMLAAKYNVEKYPTTVFITAEGEAIGTLGTVAGGPNPWVKRAAEIIATKGKK
jgi:thioredoxin-related protein